MDCKIRMKMFHSTENQRMKKFDKEKGSIGRDTKKTIKFPTANEPGRASEDAQNLSKEKKEIERGYFGNMCWPYR